MNAHNWIDLAQDADTGIETLRAHFTGHAYDPHWHDSYLVGVTEEGVQQFHCRRERFHSTPGKVFLLEPGEIHDGDAPTDSGFTYRMLYLDPQWLERELSALFEEAPADSQLSFANNLASDQRLAQATSTAFHSLHHGELRIVRQSAMDQLLDQLTGHLRWRQRYHQDPRLPLVAHKARDYLHAHAQQDISLDELGAVCGVDRFRLTRAFKAAYGLPPHAYLVQLRLAKARRLLARGAQPADVAMALGFADQSHMGRWFVRAYGLTPAAYRKRCSNLPDA
ncbi:AraC family transcriptional regulator [Pseudomonas chlororaphis]|uniref:AraC family transcriptional regulator n=1 Tax=Pseudomonas chlororaphis TaxID=587753 RepID=UPI0006A5CE14|nr:AraC family transcriptional regulator [Pseudomonas chlororaphis]AZC31416.1 Transcriptional regulator, AraC family [Pseudomonas chlororaphis subsp. piscium]WDG77957.1 AraC family transcriptional regulator [Pseudomonas chlororaphis]WDG82806.1 AraC family transcriptional regulator [Pseudomonas chlororaphis]WDG89209.1 AraC family transcriptional regulator [Pseudomonas chlororaphis]SDS92652.1 transcriptional regulator, AraC family [Pseudomonas chlororaphis]